MREALHRHRPVAPATVATPFKLRPAAHAISVAVCGISFYALQPQIAVAQTQTGQAANSAHRSYSIPAGPLAPALRSLASSANLLLTFTEAQTRGKTTSGLNGQYPTEAALSTLLTDTGLQAVALENGGYILRNNLTNSDASKSPDSILPTVQVTGSLESATGPVLGYTAKRSATGTKTDTPLLEIPQSISVVGRQQMEDQRAQNIQDALGYSAGLMTGISAKSPMFDDTLSIRGFEANPQNGSYYRDGMRYMVNLYNGKQEIYGLERVEVLKGPSSILYGAAAPGGIINTVTKRPTNALQ
jgi:iron complex outermembrane recepter protein